MTRRIICDVDQCRRTIGLDRYVKLFGHQPGGWVCPAHWKLVPRRMKRVLSRIRRKGRRLEALVGSNPLLEREWRIWRRVWREIVG